MTKLTWIELRKAIANHAGSSEKETATFLNALITQIQNGLKEDRQVRITGLGTFRLQEVSPRKSVDVTTGEAIVIPGYNKVSFLPEIGVKELVQSGTPTAPTEEDSPLQRLGKQADEIVSIIQNEINIPTEQERPERPDIPEIPESPEAPEKPKAEPSPEVKIQTIEKQQSAFHFLRDLLITLCVIILLLVGCFFLVKGGIRNWIEGQMNRVTLTTQAKQEPVENPCSIDTISYTTEAEDAKEAERTEVEEVAKTAEETEVVIGIPAKRVYTEFMATETIQPGSRLAYLARKYYGQTDLWVFIFEANKDRYANPNAIPMGEEIRIPVLPNEWQDLNNPQVRQTIDQLLNEYTR